MSLRGHCELLRATSGHGACRLESIGLDPLQHAEEDSVIDLDILELRRQAKLIVIDKQTNDNIVHQN